MILMDTSRAYIDQSNVAKLTIDENLFFAVPDSIADVIIARLDLIPLPLSALLR